MQQSEEDRRKRLNDLVSELGTLDPERDAARLRALMAEGAALSDRSVEPLRWAAFRSKYALLSEPVDPAAAIAAYREALEVWDSATERDNWLACHEGIGWLLAQQAPLSPEQQQEAIDHLECVVGEHPYMAAALAALYQFHTLGDPYENWKKRVAYLEQDAALVAKNEDPVRWAKKQNALAIACQEEPDVNFNQALERRIARHQQALDILPDRAGDAWIETCIALSECYRFLGGENSGGNLDTAERFARDDVNACHPDQDWRLRAEALLGLARVLLRPGRSDHAMLGEVWTLCDGAASLIDKTQSPSLMATVETFRANICLERMKAGDTVHVAGLIEHGAAALALLDAPEALRSRRVVCQVVADGLLLAGQYAQAAGYLRRALDEAGAALAQASSTTGRMERIWEYRDSSALLAYCLLRLDNTDEALNALDLGKAVFWRTDAGEWKPSDLQRLIPPGGALLFANFAASSGAVVIVAERGKKIVWLPRFGRERLLELQRGGIDAESLGGWLLAYHQQHSQPDAWRQMIDDTSRILYEEFWTPVLDELACLDIAPAAELVWFHQGGSGVFPMHAAWRAGENGERHWLIDDYTIRYAPSVGSLLVANSSKNSHEKVLLLVDPLGNLPFAEIESAWVRQALGSAPAQVLQGADATMDAALSAIPQAGILHLATHARFDLNRPLQSSIVLANGELLTIESLLPALKENCPALVALSACETAVTRVASTPDESLGFPAAFLHAGSRSVLATLWPVDDAASAFLVGRFYREMRSGPKSPAQALRSAQNWLRTATVGELMVLLREAREMPSPAGPLAAGKRSEFRKDPPDKRPYAEPWYWAAFTLSGQE
jgi:CHAT domain-containing protein